MKKGFTLAEVLVTLVMIGVVAALTIPSLMSNINDQQYKIAWRKAFADISQATSRVVIDNGGNLKGVFTDSDSVRDSYLPYLNYVKSCDYLKNFGNCWHNMDGSLTALDGTPITGWSSGGGLILNNGTLIRFKYNDTNCNYTGYGIPICGHMTVDVNGFKGPNAVGKDVFFIHITENSAKPFGMQSDTLGNKCIGSTDSYSGMGCSALYLYQ